MKNVHIFKNNFDPKKVLLLSDIHWDNPKCDRVLLKRHLDQAMEMDARICMNGDTLCLMQGRADRRGSKSGIRPEHNVDHYFDAVVNDAIEWFSPYAKNIDVISYGNHETAIIKWQETDILQRFVDLLNLKCHSNVQVGGYGGWIIVKMNNHTRIATTKIKYFHGSGGGGVVTKGALNLTRALELYEGCDVYTMGHIHENAARNDVRDALESNSKKGYSINHKPIHLMITGCYKEEYGDGSKGWHVERGAPIKPIGGRMLTINIVRNKTKDVDETIKYIDSKRIF